MPRRPSITAAFLLIALLVFNNLAPELQAQSPRPPTPQQLDQLLAPIALYPDSLLAQITTASTNPQEILDVANWLASNTTLTGTALTDAAQQQGFDPAFIALTNFPAVLQMMADNIDDYAAIGEAVTANQEEVAASIQRLRAQAYNAGSLRSNQQQQVEVQQASGQTIYVIQPAQPQVVYVPRYDPTVVYVAPSTSTIVATSLITFGAGIAIGALIANNHPWGWGGWGWNWGGRRIYYNNGPWGGWYGGYRPPHIWYRPRPIYYGGRPGYGGNWGYRPPHYRPPYPSRLPVYTRPGTRPVPYRPAPKPAPSRPGGQPGKPPTNTRPGTKPANPPTNTRPGTKPANPPTNTRPGTKPGNANRPAVQPTQPGNKPTPKPHPRPAPQAKPAQQSRPSPQSKPGKQTRPAGASNKDSKAPTQPNQGGNQKPQ